MTQLTFSVKNLQVTDLQKLQKECIVSHSSSHSLVQSSSRTQEPNDEELSSGSELDESCNACLLSLWVSLLWIAV